MNKPLQQSHDVRAGRLSQDELEKNFTDLHPPLNDMQAAVESARCLFCFDAPCTEACPTGIDIPGFIRKISSGNTRGAAITILSENIMGGTCARVCPVEELCEQVCVKNTAESKPVTIGKLQRYATDHLFSANIQPFQRAADTGRKIAVVGAGPAGLSCAHRLAILGHRVTVFEARSKAGGLNEYGIAAYKMVDDQAAKEVAFILSVGGIGLQTGKALGSDFSLASLQHEFDAVFLGLGHNASNSLDLDNDTGNGMHHAVDFISRIRQENLSDLPVGRRVIVIGGGNTAIDIAVQIRQLGAELVTLVYRRGPNDMSATEYEREIAQTHGVLIRCWAEPIRIHVDKNGILSVTFEQTQAVKNGQLAGTGRFFDLEADQVFKAIGQYFDDSALDSNDSPEMDNGRIRIDSERRTSLPGIWAGGDCVPGKDLTVSAVQDGKLAALSIHQFLMTQEDE